MHRPLSAKRDVPISPDMLRGDVTLSTSPLVWNRFHSSSERAMHINSRLNMGPICNGPHLLLERPGRARMACWIEEHEGMVGAYLCLDVNTPFAKVPGLGMKASQRCPLVR